MAQKPTTVCSSCIAEPGITEFIEAGAEHTSCSFCGKRSRKPFAATFDDVMDFINERICEHYEDPAEGMAWESAEGGYQGETFLSWDLIRDELCLDLPNDNDDSLFEAIRAGLRHELWCQADPYGLTPEDALHFSWERFCRTVKHELRYFFGGIVGDESDEVLSPADTLARLFDYAGDMGLFVRVPCGTELFRARRTLKGKSYEDAKELGPPPTNAAFQANRMSPPGIVMMYASEDRRTALAETASEPGRYTVGTFVTRREALILDISQRSEIPTIFQKRPDALPYDPRPRRIFLNEVARDISKSIARDDRIHVEYVPTQVVTEYLRTVTTVDGRRIDGIRYKSSRNNSKEALVLFATQENMIYPEKQREGFYNLAKDRWIELTSAQRGIITARMLGQWK